MIVERFSFWLVFTAFSWFAMQYFGYCKTAFDLRKGKFPNKLAEFPTYRTSQYDYEKVLYKLSVFFDTIELKSRVEMVLTQNDINTLCTEKTSISLTSTEAYVFYELQDNGIIEKMILLPFMSIKGYQYREKKIQFVSENRELKEKFHILNKFWIEDNGTTIPICYSPLLIFIFGGSRNPAFLGYSELKTREYKKARNTIKKVKSIESQKGFLIIRIRA